MANTKSEKLIYSAVGRRKSSVARVFLTPGKGEIVVNGKKIDVNFVKSVYGKRPNGVMGTLSRATKDGRVLYINKQKFYAMQSHFVTTFAIKQLSKYKTCHSYQSVNAQNAVTNREMYALRYMHYAG